MRVPVRSLTNKLVNQIIPFSVATEWVDMLVGSGGFNGLERSIL
jgi:hypothetical protein